MIEIINDLLPDYAGDETVKLNLKKALQQHFGCRNSVEVCTGTAAIEIVLKALEIPRGASVIIPDLSFIATATAVANCGLIPVSVDISDFHFGMTLESLKQGLNRSVAAVIVVHLAGIINREIIDIAAFCREKGIFLIEDCAQAFPCSIGDRRVGTFGDAGTCSFQASKIINAGEGGCIITDSQSLALKCLAIANWGFAGGCQHYSFPCSNFRLSALQSYFLLKQIRMLPIILEKRFLRVRELARTFADNGIEPCFPNSDERFHDCPFFIPIRSVKKINLIEPRTEYPMRNSKMVRTILQKYYPDLLSDYIAKNRSLQETTCDRIIKTIDFINIHNVNGIPADRVVLPYLKAD